MTFILDMNSVSLLRKRGKNENFFNNFRNSVAGMGGANSLK